MEHVSTLIRAWTGAALDLLFPPLCSVCDEAAPTSLCQRCWGSIERLRPPWCAVCGNPFTEFPPGTGFPPITGVPDDGPSGGADAAVARCGPCRVRPPVFTYARAGARYEGSVKEALHAFKFSRRVALAEPLSALMLMTAAGGLPCPAEVVVPVPLHPARARQRGFNQAALLARRVARSLGATLDERGLARWRATAAQADLRGPERRANVRGAFRLRDSGTVRGRHVVLVDDVLTTGATVSECARVLRAGGAASVGILTVARVVERIV